MPPRVGGVGPSHYLARPAERPGRVTFASDRVCVSQRSLTCVWGSVLARRNAGPIYIGGYSAVSAVCLVSLSATFGCCRLVGSSDHLSAPRGVPTFAAGCPGYAVFEVCRIPGSASEGLGGISLRRLVPWASFWWVNCCCSRTVVCLLWLSPRPRAIVHQRWRPIPLTRLRVKCRLVAAAARLDSGAL